ncbi:hypothetical protein ASPZODRAFT_145899 [Penicilliopsis zonata CBS 506.65]|uniref:Late sexual development protein n=1 Tax=Penicilliopsis zonata CBS 506.65 TaxID=1073090 RepID=A0A1L9S8S0_9EURO|nr:hypothetical protein ASPZODRAFT_145899 [Penicilliopsis zonata CBS 506.65]OJJ43544.1 hypothetical protein ASPZODRAFT_145899 [Penicilliopsis zonata CBS 506.65]
MKLSIILGGLAITLSTAAPLAPRVVDYSPFPLADGFPNPSQEQIEAIQQQALGTLPNSPPPPTISAEGITNLQLIALNEIFEVAFFTELLANVTTGCPGFELDETEKEQLVEILTAVQAQEQLHALSANTALKNFNVAEILPCEYNFRVSNLSSALTLASTFTSLVLGTLQDVIEVFAENGDAALAAQLSSVVGQEGEQQGFYRFQQGKIPSELPFLTVATREFAFNALIQQFIVPGSCPNINTINIPQVGPLNLIAGPDIAQNISTVQFEFTLSGQEEATEVAAEELKLAYVNQQNVPIVEDLQILSIEGQTVLVQAPFPYREYLMNGLTVAAIVEGKQFATAQDVSKAMEFGPALIIIN